MRLRFWLIATDAAHWLYRRRLASHGLYLWTVGKASDATDWGPALEAEQAGEGTDG